MIDRHLDRSGFRWAVAVVLPVALILVDPAVFHSRIFGVGMPILGRVKPFCYAATAIAVMTAAVWLRRRQPSAFSSGVLTGGALFAIVLGCALLPFSALGIFFLGLGLLGFTPFVMAAVHLKVAREAFPGATAHGRRWLAFALGAAIALGVPAGVQWAAARSLRESLADVASADPALARRGVERLHRWSILLDIESLVQAYRSETDTNRQARIAAAYQELSGRDVERRAVELND
jgi:hypothetical protein